MATAKQQKGGEVQNLPAFAQVLEALIEDRNELKAENRLNTRQDHARFVGRMGGLFLERFAVFVFHRFLTSRRPDQRRRDRQGCGIASEIYLVGTAICRANYSWRTRGTRLACLRPSLSSIHAGA
jgi:hypothetical protein